MGRYDAFPWRASVDVTQLTDTDLEASRRGSLGLSDSAGRLQSICDPLLDTEYFETISEIGDCGLRVGVADVIDDHRTTVTREDFDVAYTIPPEGWVAANTPLLADPPTIKRSEEYEKYTISTPEVVIEMARAIAQEGAARDMNTIMKVGIWMIAGAGEYEYLG